jgi:ABC-2 type transport system ATP-binding protein
MTPPPVRCEGLVKTFGAIRAVDRVSLTVAEGDVYGYLGPNGAGKTTSMRMMLGLVRPTEGRTLLFGRDPLLAGKRALAGVAGFVEEPRFYPYLSGRTNLDLLAHYDGDGAVARIDEVLDLVDLRGRARDRVGGYSHGMRQRLGIAAALLRRPRLLILDEPTTGLDPAGIRDMKELVRRLAGDGMTIVLSSHQMAEVQELCSRVGIIQRGRILYEGSLDELLAQASMRYGLRATDQERALRIAAAGGIRAERAGDLLRFAADEEAVVALSLALGRAGVGIRSLEREQPTLEQLFFRLTEGRDEGAPEQEREVA